MHTKGEGVEKGGCCDPNDAGSKSLAAPSSAPSPPRAVGAGNEERRAVDDYDLQGKDEEGGALCCVSTKTTMLKK